MSSKRRLRRKACTGKQRFETQEAARAAISRLRRDTGTASLLLPYRCHFCHGFHFGHPPRAARDSYRARQ